MKLADLIADLPGVRVEGDLSVDVRQVMHDSRRIEPGGLYIALPGRFYAGVKWIPDALARGACVVALADDVPDAPLEGAAAVLRLAHPRATMAALAARLHGHPSAKLGLIGVTGTNGKTTTTTLIADMVREAGLPDGLIGTNGIRVGGRSRAAWLTTPEAPDLQALFAEMVTAGVPVAAMEVSSIGLAEDRCEAVTYAAAGFTNLTVDHLDYHGDMATYGAAKRRLFDALLARDGVAVINVEDAFGARLAHSLPQHTVWRLSLEDPHADVWVRGLKIDGDGCRGVLVTPRGDLPFECPLPGRYNAVNAALAGALAIALDLPWSAIGRALAKASVAGRMQRVPNAQGLTVVVDYAHSDDALGRAIEALRPLTTGHLWCVFGCGGDRDATKRGPMGAAAATADGVIITNDNPRSEDPATIAAAALVGAVQAGRPEVARPTPGGTWIELDRRLAITAALAVARPGDTVLIAGKGHEKYQEINGIRHDFDDVTVARDALRAERAATGASDGDRLSEAQRLRATRGGV